MKSKKEKFLFLLNNELRSVFKVSVITMIAFMLIHVAVIIFKALEVRSFIEKGLKDGVPIEAMVNSALECQCVGEFFSRHPQVILVPILGAAIIVIYAMVTWFKEWFGNTKTIYTLMSLPISKKSIILSKFCSIVILYYTFMATQALTLYIDNFILSRLLLKGSLCKNSIFEVSNIPFWLPTFNLKFGLFYLLIVLSGVMIAFSLALLERSFKVKGIIIGIIKSCFWIFMYLVVIIKGTYYPSEIFTYILILSLVSIIINFILSSYLLENKISL